MRPEQYQSADPPLPPRPIIRWIGVCALLFGIAEAIDFTITFSRSANVILAIFKGRSSVDTMLNLGLQAIHGIGAIGLLWGGLACLVHHPYTAALLFGGSVAYILRLLVSAIFFVALSTRRDNDWLVYLIRQIAQNTVDYGVPLLLLAFLSSRAGRSLLRQGVTTNASSSPDHGENPAAYATLSYARQHALDNTAVVGAAATRLLEILPWAIIALSLPAAAIVIGQIITTGRLIPWTYSELTSTPLPFWTFVLLYWSGLFLLIGAILLFRKRALGIQFIRIAVLLTFVNAALDTWNWYEYLLAQRREPFHFIFTSIAHTAPPLLSFLLVIGLLTSAAVRSRFYLAAPAVEEAPF